MELQPWRQRMAVSACPSAGGRGLWVWAPWAPLLLQAAEAAVPGCPSTQTLTGLWQCCGRG